MTELFLNLSNFALDSNLSSTNNSNSTIYVNEELERFVSITVFFLFSFIFFAGLIGNGLVVMVVAANPMMRSTTNILIINLAVADLLFVIFCVPFTATDYILESWPFGDFMCRFVQYMIVVTCHASVYTLVLMSLDRFLAVVHPIKSISYRTEVNALLSLGVLWFTIIISAVPVWFSHGEFQFVWKTVDAPGDSQQFVDELEGQITMVKCVFSEETHNLPLFQILFFLTSYVVPLALISVLYVCMLMSLWKGRTPGGKASAEARRGRVRVTSMVVAVVLAFAICWLPIQIILVLKSIDLYHQTSFLVIFQIISHVLAYLSSCVNPLLYAFLSENFRKAFRKVIVRCAPQYNFQPSYSTKISRPGHAENNDIL